MKADLHVHTRASDGRLTPAEVIRRSAELGMNVIAITDHDSVEGIDSALKEAEKFPELLVIPGVELSTNIPQGEVHILGFFVNHNSAEFRKRLLALRDSRSVRAERMISKLTGAGMRIEWEHMKRVSGEASMGRPHVAQAMLEKGYISCMQEAFDKYIGRNCPAYVDREKQTPAEAVELILSAKGLPILAHPAEIQGLESLVADLVSVGLVGMEVFYKNYPKTTKKRLEKLANKYGIVCCGGSDYHGYESDEATHNNIGKVDLPKESVDRLIALAEQRLV